MDIIIDNVEDSERYTKLRGIMEERANACYIVHKGACEAWKHGEPVRVWRDEYGILCIAYEDGSWWHYGFKISGLEWW